MPKKQIPIAGSKLPGGLDHTKMFGLLGYNIAQAAIPAYAAFDKHVGAPLQLRRTDYTILVLLEANTGVTPKRLSSALGVTGPSLTSMLDTLESRGWVKRERSQHDGRVQHLSLSVDGKKLLQKANRATQLMEDDLTRHLSEAEYSTLKELLQKIAVHRRP
jgi:DNA-binding MarR family transcriptional regulator